MRETASEKGDDLQPLTFADMLRREGQNDEGWLIESIFRRKAIHLITAPPETAKSWLMAYTCLCLTTGEEWFGRPVNYCQVLWLDAELSEPESLRRFKALGFQVNNERFLYMPDARLRLDDDNQRETLKQIITDSAPDVVVLDSLIRFHEGDENSNKEMSKLFVYLDGMRKELECAFFLLHHTTKSASGEASFRSIRGAGDILGMVDIGYGITKDSDTFEVKTTKNRFVPDADKLSLCFRLEGKANEPVALRVTEKETSTRSRDKKADNVKKERILQVLRRQEIPINQNTLEGLVGGIGTRKLKLLAEELQAEGLIIIETTGAKSKSVLYRIASQ